MEAVVAGLGAFLLAISFGGAGGISSKFATTAGAVPQGDRVFAALLGFDLVALAAILQARTSHQALWADIGVGAVIAVGYAVFIGRCHVFKRADCGAKKTEEEIAVANDRRAAAGLPRDLDEHCGRNPSN